MKRLVSYIEKETGEKSALLGLALSSRKNLCINEAVGLIFVIFMF